MTRHLLFYISVASMSILLFNSQVINCIDFRRHPTKWFFLLIEFCFYIFTYASICMSYFIPFLYFPSEVMCINNFTRMNLNMTIIACIQLKNVTLSSIFATTIFNKIYADYSVTFFWSQHVQTHLRHTFPIYLVTTYEFVYWMLS